MDASALDKSCSSEWKIDIKKGPRIGIMFALARFLYIDVLSLYVPRTSLYRGS